MRVILNGEHAKGISFLCWGGEDVSRAGKPRPYE